MSPQKRKWTADGHQLYTTRHARRYDLYWSPTGTFKRSHPVYRSTESQNVRKVDAALIRFNRLWRTVNG